MSTWRMDSNNNNNNNSTSAEERGYCPIVGQLACLSAGLGLLKNGFDETVRRSAWTVAQGPSALIFVAIRFTIWIQGFGIRIRVLIQESF